MLQEVNSSLKGLSFESLMFVITITVIFGARLAYIDYKQRNKIKEKLNTKNKENVQ